jgi:hypothetical protein
MDAHDPWHISVSAGEYPWTTGIPTVVMLNGMEGEIETVEF